MHDLICDTTRAGDADTTWAGDADTTWAGDARVVGSPVVEDAASVGDGAA